MKLIKTLLLALAFSVTPCHAGGYKTEFRDIVAEMERVGQLLKSTLVQTCQDRLKPNEVNPYANSEKEVSRFEHLVEWVKNLRSISGSTESLGDLSATQASLRHDHDLIAVTEPVSFLARNTQSPLRHRIETIARQARVGLEKEKVVKAYETIHQQDLAYAGESIPRVLYFETAETAELLKILGIIRDGLNAYQTGVLEFSGLAAIDDKLNKINSAIKERKWWSRLGTFSLLAILETLFISQNWTDIELLLALAQEQDVRLLPGALGGLFLGNSVGAWIFGNLLHKIHYESPKKIGGLRSSLQSRDLALGRSLQDALKKHDQFVSEPAFSLISFKLDGSDVDLLWVTPGSKPSSKFDSPPWGALVIRSPESQVSDGLFTVSVPSLPLAQGNAQGSE